jgi:hypothetical protein
VTPRTTIPVVAESPMVVVSTVQRTCVTAGACRVLRLAQAAAVAATRAGIITPSDATKTTVTTTATTTTTTTTTTTATGANRAATAAAAVS